MILEECALYSMLGRSGTTFIRNQLGKYDEFLCLITNQQVELLKTLQDEVRLSTYGIHEFVQYDIKALYSSTDVNLERIKTVIYKMPIYKIIESVSLEHFNRIKPVIVMRNPILTVFSASKKDFLKDSDNFEVTKFSILNACKSLNISFPDELIHDYNRYEEDILLKNAVLFKMSFYIYKYYFNTYYKGEFLFFSFEDFMNNPENSMNLLLQYYKATYSLLDIKKQLQKVIYADTREEGGINMSANLEKQRNLTPYDKNDFDRVYEYLKEEINTLGYEHDISKYPKSRILTRI